LGLLVRLGDVDSTAVELLAAELERLLDTGSIGKLNKGNAKK